RLHDCPSILLECAFMSNDKDLEMLISSKYQNALATELAKGIVDYFKPISAIYSTVSATVKSNSQLPSTAVATTTLIAPAGMIALIRKRKKSK
ncbi:MAG: N-acetylmuramoyl-L-alanine amidase, partial [Oscillospiraceae bacterium]|nr:N-acetylmuramoyl-L-alanine amidase [Oscillospiraceae bacterium]